MERRSIWRRLGGRVARERAIRKHERADRGLMRTFTAGLLTEEERRALVERFSSANAPLLLPERPAARLECWIRRHPDWRQRVVREAGNELRGELALFGRVYPIQKPEDWHRDPEGLMQWPQVPHARIRLDDPHHPGDVRMQWEPARFHHALRLGRAYLATGRDEYPAAFLRQVDSFEKGNRPFDSIHWAVGMEVAIRAVNWVLALEFLRGCDLFTEERYRQWINLLLLHGLFLEHHIEIHSMGPTNHTLADYAGLIVLARAMDCTAIGRRWMDNAAPALESALARQVLEGGAQSEGSLPYERFVLEACLVADLCLDDDRRGGLRGLLRSMATHLCDATLAGRLPFVGDGDDSFFPPFGLRPFEDLDPLDPGPVLQLAARQLGDGKLRFPRETAEEAYWLGVCESGGPSAPCEIGSGSHEPGSFRSTGFVRFEVGAFQGLILVRDAAEGWIPTHGHNDLLSIVLTFDGFPLLIDPGTGGYAWDRTLRQILRSTASHSTLQIEGIEQSPIAERRTFEAPRPLRCVVESFQSDPLDVRISCHLTSNNLVHERTLRSDSGLIRIEDRLLAVGPEQEGGVRRSTVRYLLAPGLKPTPDSEHPSVWSIETPSGTVRFLLLRPEAAAWQSLTVPASHRYGSKEMVSSLTGTFSGPLPHRWLGIVVPPDRSLRDLAGVEIEEAAEGR